MNQQIRTKNEAHFAAHNRAHNTQLLFYDRSQHAACYGVDLIVAIAGVAAVALAGMLYWHASFFSSVSKQARFIASSALVTGGPILALAGAVSFYMRQHDRQLLKDYKPVDLDKDANLRAFAGAGIPKPRPEKSEEKSGVIDLGDGRFVYYTHDGKGDAETLLKDFSVEQINENMLPLLGGTGKNGQLIYRDAQRVVVANYGDNIAFIQRGKSILPLSEAQSENPFYTKSRTVVTEVKLQEGDRIVMGARQTVKQIEELMAIYFQQITAVAKLCDGQIIN